MDDIQREEDPIRSEDIDETPIYDNPTFVDDKDVSTVQQYSTPILPKVHINNLTKAKLEIRRQEVTRFFEEMKLNPENIELNLDMFEVKNENGNNILYFRKAGRLYNLTRKSDGKFRTRKELERIFTKKNLNKIGSIKKLDETIPTPREVENIPLKELSERLSKAQLELEKMPAREILGLDKLLQSLPGEYINSAAKLTEVEDHIDREHQKLDEATTDEQRERINERIRRLRDERELRIETMTQLEPKLQTQLARIRRTIDKIVEPHRTLREKLSILWREQGLTIISVLTAIGMTIATLALALIPRGGGGGGKNPHKVYDYVKKSLRALSRVLKRFGSWALKALPGILGSLISGIFNLMSKVVTKVAEHGYIAITIMAGGAVYLINEHFYAGYSKR